MRRLLPIVLMTGAVAAAAGPAAPAGAAQPRACKAADLRYPFMPGGPKTFGVLRLTINTGSCATARRVAKAWADEYESNIDAGDDSVPRIVAGFAFSMLQTREPQELRLRGRRRSVSIRFDYRVPNG